MRYILNLVACQNPMYVCRAIDPIDSTYCLCSDCSAVMCTASVSFCGSCGERNNHGLVSHTLKCTDWWFEVGKGFLYQSSIGECLLWL